MINTLIKHKDKIILMKLALLQISISFFTNFFIVKKIGFTDELDIFYLAMGVYLFLHTSINWPFAAILTPLMIENKEKNLEKNLFFNIIFLSLLIFLILFSTMFIWIDLFFINYLENVEIKIIKTIQSIFLVTFVFDSLNLVFLSILQQKNKFILINILNLFSSIVCFTFIYFTIDEFGIYSATYGQLIMRIFIFIILFVLFYKLLKNSSSYKTEYITMLFNKVKHLLFGSFYFRLGDLLDRYIASYLSSGFLSLVSFIQKLYEAINTVLNTSIVAPTITKFSYLNKEKRYKEMKNILYVYVLFLFVVVTIIFLFIAIFGEQLFLIFFKDKITDDLSSVLFISLISIFIICYSQTMGKIFQNLLLSLNQEKLITLYDMASFTITIFLKILMTYYMGIYGFLISFVFSEILKVLFKAFLLFTQIRKIDAK